MCRYRISVVVVMALLALLAGCSSDAVVGAGDVSGSEVQVQSHGNDHALAPAKLDIALREIAGLDAPDGVDNEVFAGLQTELARLLRDGVPAETDSSRLTSSPVYDPVAYDASGKYLGGFLDTHWPTAIDGSTVQNFYVPGDYDDNGQVNAADIIPLARNLGMKVDGGNNNRYRIDYDDNNLITAADLIGIARNFGEHVVGLNLFSSADIKDFPWLPNEADRIDPYSRIGIEGFRPGGARKLPSFEYSLEGVPAGHYFWTRVQLAIGQMHVGWPLRSSSQKPLPANLEFSYSDGVAYCAPYMPGDTDNNTEVNLSDITAIGKQTYIAEQYVKAGVDIPEYLDRNGDGHVAHADGICILWEVLSFIGRRWMPYTVYWTQDPQSLPDEVYEIPESVQRVAFDAEQFRVEFENRAMMVMPVGEIPSGSYVWVDNTYLRSEVIQIP